MLIDQLLANMRVKDAGSYTNQFANSDSLIQIMNRIVPASPAEAKRLDNIKAHPEKLRQYDPNQNPEIEAEFKRVLQKGIDSGIHWSEIMLMRYELEKMILTKDMIGFEKLTPLRLQGYVFVQDMLTTRMYIIAVKNIFLFKGLIYGAQVVNVLEAQSMDEYYEKLAAERKMEKQKMLAEMYPDTDTATTTTDSKTAAVAKPKGNLEIDIDDEDKDQDEKKQLKKVKDRKYFVGTLDDEMRIELYLRSLEGDCPEPVCGWEAIYKFGDNEEYLKLDVVKKPDGKWVMTEESEEGILELTLKGSHFDGAWLSPQDKVEYEVKMEERPDVKVKKLYMLDDIIEGF